MKINIFKMAAMLLLLTLNYTNMNAQNNSQSLNAHQQSMVRIAALTAAGNTDQLKIELATGLDVGMTVNEIKEALVQLYAYCGFPRSLNGINALMAVVEERKAKGIKDVEGKNAAPINETNKYETGKKTLEMLTGKPQSGPLSGANAFAPAIDTFLKEHLFADIFSRDVLNPRQREFVTISALAAMTGVAPQLQAHIGMGMNTGITEAQIKEVFSIIETSIGKNEANTGREALSKVLAAAQEDK